MGCYEKERIMIVEKGWAILTNGNVIFAGKENTMVVEKKDTEIKEKIGLQNKKHIQSLKKEAQRIAAYWIAGTPKPSYPMSNAYTALASKLSSIEKLLSEIEIDDTDPA